MSGNKAEYEKLVSELILKTSEISSYINIIKNYVKMSVPNESGTQISAQCDLASERTKEVIEGLIGLSSSMIALEQRLEAQDKAETEKELKDGIYTIRNAIVEKKGKSFTIKKGSIITIKPDYRYNMLSFDKGRTSLPYSVIKNIDTMIYKDVFESEPNKAGEYRLKSDYTVEGGASTTAGVICGYPIAGRKMQPAGKQYQ